MTRGAVELWLALDRRFLENELGIPANEVMIDRDMIGRIKGALARYRHGMDYDEAVRHFVRHAPVDVFKKWLTDPSLHDLYTDCRNAALQLDCPVQDELREEPTT